MVTPSLLSRVIESQEQDTEVLSIMDRVQVTKAGTFTRMVVFGIGDRGDSQGVSLLPFCCTPRWHENVPRSSSSVFLEWDKETRWRFCSSMSHMSASKG